MKLTVDRELALLSIGNGGASGLTVDAQVDGWCSGVERVAGNTASVAALTVL